MTDEQKKYIEYVKKLIDVMTNEQRLILFTFYCAYCGKTQEPKGKGCQCWNDE